MDPEGYALNPIIQSASESSGSRLFVARRYSEAVKAFSGINRATTAICHFSPACYAQASATR